MDPYKVTFLLLGSLHTNLYLHLGRCHPLLPARLHFSDFLCLEAILAWQTPAATQPSRAASLKAFLLHPVLVASLSHASATRRAFLPLHCCAVWCCRSCVLACLPSDYKICESRTVLLTLVFQCPVLCLGRHWYLRGNGGCLDRWQMMDGRMEGRKERREGRTEGGREPGGRREDKS